MKEHGVVKPEGQEVDLNGSSGVMMQRSSFEKVLSPEFEEGFEWRCSSSGTAD